MKKILKYKSFISFCLVFLLVFGVVTDYKQKEVQAIAIVDDIFFWTIGALLIASTGVVIGSNSQIEYGRLFTTKWVNAGNSKDELLLKGLDGTIKGLFITAKLKNFIENFTSPTSVPSVNYNNVDAISGMKGYSNGFVYSNKYSVPDTVKSYFPTDYKFTINLPVSVVKIKFIHGAMSKTFNCLNSSFANGKLRLSIRGYSSMSSTTAYFTFYDIYNTKISENEWYYTSSGYLDTITSFSKIIGIDSNGNEVPLSFQEPLDYDISNIDSTTINKNLVQDLPDKGYLPLPTTEVIESSKGTTIPREDIKTRVEGIPLEGDKAGTLNPDGSLSLDNTKSWDNTGTGEGEGTGEGTGFWDWLKSLLNSILNAIKSILSFITDFLAALLEGLKDLLLALFVPSETYFTDVFSDLKNILGSRLNIDSYTQLFNSDYGESTIKDITINVFGQTVTIVRFSIYEHFRDLINTLIYAFMFFLLAIYNYSQVYKLIRGSDYVGASSTITHMGGGLTQADEIKQSNNERSIRRINGGRL